MNITWYGQTCFRINTQKNRNSSVNILIDPPDKESGLRGPKLEADIVLITHDNKPKKGISRDSFLIEGPGEYDIKGVYIYGLPTLTKEGISEKTAIYVIEAEEMKICHLGLLGRGELTSNQLERIGEVDILMVPIGGADTIDAKGAIKIMAQIEPKITIPMYYKIPKLKIKLTGLDEFLKALGIKSLQPLSKLSIKKRDLSGEEAKIIALEP